MDLALWGLQILLALGFVFAGYNHWLNFERSKIRMVWLTSVPSWFVPLLGILEIAGGIALVLPALTRIEPWLTPLAAALLALLMVFAIVFHIARRETRNIAVNLVLGLLAAFVAYGRYMIAPI